MNNIPPGATIAKVQMDRILESAVVLSWKDLLHPCQKDLIQIEYAPVARLQYLKIWQLTGKGQWSLVCEYWMPHGTTEGQAGGMMFSNDYHSAVLAEMLGVIMQHQDNFAPAPKPGAGLIQVTLPTEQDNLASVACMKHVYESFGLNFAHVAAAAVA